MNDDFSGFNFESMAIPISELMPNVEQRIVEPLPDNMEIWDMTGIRKSWSKEPWDELIPKDGFFYDFCLAFRGYAPPTAYWLWGAIIAMSTMLGRDAWLEWGDGQLFTNFYTLLVGPAGRLKKSTVIDKVDTLIHEYTEMIPSEVVAFQKETPTLQGKASEASLYMLMENKKQVVVDESGQTVTIESDGKVFACVNELSTFLSKQSYSSGIVEKMTDMYDCKKHDSEMTRSRGENRLKNIYSTFMAGTTAKGLRNSIPESAFGDGFMSRLTTVYIPEPTRIFPFPMKMVGTPKIYDLKQRLAWLALRARGEYILSPEASKYYSDWYFKWYDQLKDTPDEKSLSNRQDIITLKLATIICAQRYNHAPGMDKIIKKSDYILAEKIIKRSIASANQVMDTIGEDKFFFNLGRVKTVIQNHSNTNDGKPIERTKLIRKMSSKKVTVKMVNEILQQLIDTDQISVYDKNMNAQNGISGTGTELYELTGGA